MKNIIESYWKLLQRKLSEEQSFYLFMLMILTAFQKKRSRIDSMGGFTQREFRGIFSSMDGWGMEGKALSLEEKIDWSLFSVDDEIQKIIEDIFREFCAFFSKPCQNNSLTISEEVSRLNMLLEMVLDSTATGIMGGYITTPRSIRRLVEELFNRVDCKDIADFCCGIGVFGMGICRKINEKRCKEEKSGALPISFYGAEMDSSLCMIGNILLKSNGITGNIEQRNVLALSDESRMRQYDLIVMDTPRGGNRRMVYDVWDPRMRGFSQKTVYSDWIFIQDVLYHLRDGGRAAVLCTTGALIRANECSLRKQIIEKDWLEAVITLPVNLYPNTRTGTELLIFHKGKSMERREKILFVDISRYYLREKRNAYVITEEGMKMASDCFQDFKGVDGISIIRESDTLDSQTYSWKPIQYLYQGYRESRNGEYILSEIAEIVRGAQAVKKDIGKEAKHRDIEETGETVYFINIKDIQEGIILYETAEKISRGNSACKEKYRIREDDILITSKGTSIKMAIVGNAPPPAYISGNVTRIRVNRTIYDPHVLYYYLDSEQGRALLEQIQSGSTIRILNNANLSMLKAPRYNLKKMKELGSQLKVNRETFLKRQKELVKNYDAERKYLLGLLEEEW